MSDNPYSSPTSAGDAPLPKTKRRWFVPILAVLGGAALLVALLLPTVRTARPAALRNLCMSNLKQIGTALHLYAGAHGGLPPAYTVDGEGRPLHSWRTLILPYMEEKALYDAIDLTKPWDDPANLAAFNAHSIPYAYACPLSADNRNKTTYLAVVASNGCFLPTEPRRMADITDGPSKTLMVVEVPDDRAVPWMSPQDASDELLATLGPKSNHTHSHGAHALFVDLHVLFLDWDIPRDLLRALITVSGNEEVDPL